MIVFVWIYNRLRVDGASDYSKDLLNFPIIIRAENLNDLGKTEDKTISLPSGVVLVGYFS